MSDTFLKWAGGKNWFVNNENERFPNEFNRYIEPFLGSGAVFFHLQPQNAILSDINQELISTYISVRDEVGLVYGNLRRHQRNNNRDYYYKIRETRTRTTATSAARMIYLNRTCFNGIYRVNRQGEFNVPFGTERDIIFDRGSLERASGILQNVDILCQDFQNTIEMAEENDFVFCDPPYAVVNEDNRFVSYTADIFSWEDQIRLQQVLRRAKDRGVKIVMTNVDHPAVRGIYENVEGFELDTVTRSCFISGTAKGRRAYKELIVSANIHK